MHGGERKLEKGKAGVRAQALSPGLDKKESMQLIRSIPEQKQRQKIIVIDFHTGSLGPLLINNYFKWALSKALALKKARWLFLYARAIYFTILSLFFARLSADDAAKQETQIHVPLQSQ